MNISLNTKKITAIGGLILVILIVFLWIGITLYRNSVQRYDKLQVAADALADMRIESAKKERTQRDEIKRLKDLEKQALAQYEAEKDKVKALQKKYDSIPQTPVNVNDLKTLADCKEKMEKTQQALDDCKKYASTQTGALTAGDIVIGIKDEISTTRDKADAENGIQKTMLEAENGKYKAMLASPRGGFFGYIKEHFGISVGAFGGLSFTGHFCAGAGVMIGFKL